MSVVATAAVAAMLLSAVAKVPLEPLTGTMLRICHRDAAGAAPHARLPLTGARFDLGERQHELVVCVVRGLGVQAGLTFQWTMKSCDTHTQPTLCNRINK